MTEYSFNTPECFSDAIKLQEIFPEEIWLQILNKISKSDHYYSICAGSPYFHQLLLPPRTQILFPEVAKVCTKSVVVLTIESYASLLLCREVCKTWKQGVDASIQNILNKTNSTEWPHFGFLKRVVSKNQQRIICQPNFKDQSKVGMFLEIFHNSHFLTGSNPFPSRSIDISFCSRIPAAIHNKLFDILQIYGHHIWHCYVQWNRSQDEMQTQQQVLFFCKLLGLLPHLQTLRIANEGTIENTEYLENLLTAKTLPTFKNLELLAEHDLAGPIFSQIIQNNPHIKKLWILELDFSNHSALLLAPLPKLEELHIMGFKRYLDYSRFISAPVQLSLKKLTILCHDWVLHVNSVFSFLQERWADSLTDLSIIIPSSVSVSEIESSLKLPNLENLRIKMRNYACLDFILDLSKSLVRLSVYHDGRDQYDDSLEKNSKIQFFSHMKNLGKSNIWKFFPRLKEIHYADDMVRALYFGRSYGRNQWVEFDLEQF